MIKLAIPLAVVLTASALLAGCGGSDDPVDPTAYTVQPFRWPQVAKEKETDGWIENAWRDPAYSYVIMTIDSRSTDETGSPLENAQLARVHTTDLQGYRERGMRWIRLSGKPAVRWAFDVGKQANIRWFFEECGVSFLVRGTTGLYGFEALSESFREMAETIKVKDCDE
jgi:hypothetical protein